MDIEGIGLYSLGSYRKKLNDKQKKEYTLLFEKYFIKTFTSRLSDYSNPEINIEHVSEQSPHNVWTK